MLAEEAVSGGSRAVTSYQLPVTSYHHQPSVTAAAVSGARGTGDASEQRPKGSRQTDAQMRQSEILQTRNDENSRGGKHAATFTN